MRAALHVVCVVVLLPYFVLASGFVLFGIAIASGSFLSFLASLLWQAAWLVSWGGLAIVTAILLVAAVGFSARFRWAGAVLVCCVAAGCAIVLITQSTNAVTFGTLLFLAPCIAVVVIAGWLAATEWPNRRFVAHPG